MAEKIPAHIREQQINELPNISFVRWDGVYKNAYSKAVCRCKIDDNEWSATVNSLTNNKNGCPRCGRVTMIMSNVARESIKIPAHVRENQINALPNISFVRWVGEYNGSDSKAICRCDIDNFEWSASVLSLINAGNGCPQCAGCRRWTVDERIDQINYLPNISFVRWCGDYAGSRSKVICRCAIDGHEWCSVVYSVVSSGRGCPKCAKSGFNPTTAGTLYVLRSECGSMVKIGISNKYKKRHVTLKRNTPFNWSCIELLHSDDGAFIAKAEKELHSLTEQARFSEPFDGYTEWRKWDDRIPMWIEEYRARA